MSGCILSLWIGTKLDHRMQLLLTRLKPLNGTYLTEQRLGYIATFSCYKYDTMRGHTDDERRVGGPLALGICRIHTLQSWTNKMVEGCNNYRRRRQAVPTNDSLNNNQLCEGYQTKHGKVGRDLLQNTTTDCLFFESSWECVFGIRE